MPPVLRTPPKITFGVTECCNLRCRHCYADCAAAPKAGELGVDDWLRIADEVIQDGVIQFYIEGGEPLAKPGFLQLLSRCAHDAMTLLRTNGTLIDQSMAAALKAAGVGRVLVDMMGAATRRHMNGSRECRAVSRQPVTAFAIALPPACRLTSWSFSRAKPHPSSMLC